MSPPATWTGVGEGAKVVVIDPYVSDNILVLSTLPNLARALSEQGAQARVASIWHGAANPHAPQHAELAGPKMETRDGWFGYTDEAVDSLSNTRDRIGWAGHHNGRFLAGLDLADADLVVVPGFANGHRVLQNRTLRADARVVVADFHMMTGINDWHREHVRRGRPMDGRWWPDERITVHALYPRYVRVYWRAGVPLRQICWRPYPIAARDFPAGPDPLTCGIIFSGGNHQRDLGTLVETARRLDRSRVHPISVFTGQEVPPPLVRRGQVKLARFYEAIANSRFVVLPLQPDHRRPAGLSVISMALAAGRPVIASCTPGAIDHLRHGANAILVPPNDPVALAAAIDRLDNDKALLGRLAAGARAAGARLEVGQWAQALLHGAPPEPALNHRRPQAPPQGPDLRGPWYSW